MLDNISEESYLVHKYDSQITLVFDDLDEALAFVEDNPREFFILS